MKVSAAAAHHRATGRHRRRRQPCAHGIDLRHQRGRAGPAVPQGARPVLGMAGAHQHLVVVLVVDQPAVADRVEPVDPPGDVACCTRAGTRSRSWPQQRVR